MKRESLLKTLSSEHGLHNVAKIGFRFGNKGTHTSRTIMLAELSQVLEICPSETKRECYAEAVLEQNCLGKRTVANRKLSLQHLRELYALNPTILLFRLLRRHWELDERGRPLLALLTALARDSLLRLTADPILHMQPGEELIRPQLTEVVRSAVKERLNDRTLDKVVRNVASSWTQSGHLRGRRKKIRQLVRPTPVVTAYALLLGYLLGIRGKGLFKTLWAQVLDTSADELISQAMDAKRLGLLDLRQAGGVIDVSFARMLTDEERRLIHGTH